MTHCILYMLVQWNPLNRHAVYRDSRFVRTNDNFPFLIKIFLWKVLRFIGTILICFISSYNQIVINTSTLSTTFAFSGRQIKNPVNYRFESVGWKHVQGHSWTKVSKNCWKIFLSFGSHLNYSTSAIYASIEREFSKDSNELPIAQIGDHY